MNQLSQMESVATRRSKRLGSGMEALLGFTLLGVYWIQFITEQNWGVLDIIQNDFAYRQLSGAVVIICLLLQWRLYFKRSSRASQPIKSQLERHRQYGMVVMILLFFHSTQLGYGYQVMMTVSLLMVILTGLFSPQRIGVSSVVYRNCWLAVHISLAAVCTLTLFYHIFIVYQYW